MKKSIITTFFSMFVCALLTILPSCAEKETFVEVSSVSLNTATIEMVEGETFCLVATVLPKDAEHDGVTWASSNASVAGVNSSGVVTALREGSATITASAGGKSSTCGVRVSAKVIAVTSVTLDKSSLSLQAGETATLTATVKPDNASNKSVEWNSSDVSVASVSDGKVTARKSGTATITAKSGNCTAECEVTVSVSTESIALDRTALSMAIGETVQLTATVSPADATDKTVTWASSDASVASVSDGKVTALRSGKTTITAKCGEKTAECVVTVSVPVTSITLDRTALSMAIGETVQLTATVSPADATDKTVTWASSDASVAKVDNGKVTAVSTGTAIITATSAGFSASCNASVTHPDNVIYYTSSDSNIVQPYDNATFGANIVSNEYVGGIGRIVFDGPVTKIGGFAFEGCRELVSVNIPEKVTEIGGKAFTKTSLQHINIPQSVTSIGKEAFAWSYGLKNVVLPESLTYLGESAFGHCSNLETINIPSGLTSIEDCIFVLCKNLKSPVVIPEGVKSIGHNAFDGCGKVTELVLPKGLKIIGSQAFSSTGINKVTIPESVTVIEYEAFGSTDLVNVEIPGSVVSFHDCFHRCHSLLSVFFCEGIKDISRNSFSGCENLKKVTLPSTITKIGEALSYSEKLSELYVKAANPPYVNDLGSFVTLRIYVPRSSVDAYKANTYWSKYKDSIVGYDF